MSKLQFFNFRTISSSPQDISMISHYMPSAFFVPCTILSYVPVQHIHFFCTVTYRYLCDNHLCCICVVCDVNCSDHPKLQIENSGKLSFFPLQKEVVQWTLELGTSTAASAGMIDLECSLCQLVVHECMHRIITSMNDNTHWKLSDIP